MKKPSISSLKKKAWKLFSEYIRIRDGGVCFTCNKKMEWKYMQAGHYVSRSFNSLLYDEINVNCQCVGCNIFKHGNLDEYALRLQKKYGKQILVKLNKEKKIIKRFSVKDLEQKVEELKKKLQKYAR